MTITVTTRIYLSPPHLGERESKYVADAIASNWIAPLGPYVDLLEKKLVDLTGTKSCAVLSSGTAALHLALIEAGVDQGDFVLCPTFTFSASANPILYQHATPVFIDSEAHTWNMDPQLCAEAIAWCIAQGKVPKAMILVHLYGMPAQIGPLMELAKMHQITVIEDAAESLGSMYHGRHTGTFGKTGVLSFNGNKIITTSGGGALISNDESLIAHARFLSTQAREKAVHYEHKETGFNYRMSNICAAIGCGQMEVLEARVARKREIFSYYVQKLRSNSGLIFLSEPEGSFSNRWLTTILVDPETSKTTCEEIRLRLERAGIESRPLWKPLHLQPVFRNAPAFLNGIAERCFTHGLCLPSGTALTNDQLDEIIALVLSR